MEPNAYSRLRPYLFHLTAAENLSSISRSRTLRPAAELLAEAGRCDLLQCRRPESLELDIRDQAIRICDQKPLHVRNMALCPDWQLEDVVELLNRHVFFWPGNVHGPIQAGLNHFRRYRNEAPVLLRVSLADVLTANPGIAPRYCRFNSGAPRWSRGRASPRGPEIFEAPETFDGKPSRVTEWVVGGSVRLPESTELSWSPRRGPWHRLL